MVQPVLTIGAVLAVILVVLGFVLLKGSKSQYLPYYPGAVIFGSGLVFVVLAPMVERMFIMDASLGGWGIACLFAAGIGLMVTAVNDVFVRT
ncbi:hypothetical protein [Ornithinibacillus halophilus]|uniref:YesK-like protein n=1 Tax=Ornithinibacillus halophilus TaxID=930117 RepID=A0A1M5JRS2_9BACI|nr:hypothetical protein [Ornithinibacillus halophilus]SHG43244.1 hypothetical protein SAMN05216225_10335 [Ornithinibacillus halophilus]